MARCNDCLKENPHRTDKDYICEECISLRVKAIADRRLGRVSTQAESTTNFLTHFPELMSKVAEDILQEDIELSKTLQHDPVTHPSHYTSGTIECIEAIRDHFSQEEYRGFLRGNSFKYRWRYRQKNGVEDLKKAEWYEKKLLELESE